MDDTTQAAPDFTLEVANGPAVTLSEQWQRRLLLLWFSRGLACPFCRRQIVQISRVYDDLRARDADVVQVTPQSVEVAQRLLEFFEVPWPYACDPEGVVAAAYDMAPGGALQRSTTSIKGQTRALGLLVTNPAEPNADIVGPAKEAHPIPTRDGGMVVVDRGGRIRFKQRTGNLSLLPSPSNLLRILDGAVAA